MGRWPMYPWQYTSGASSQDVNSFKKINHQYQDSVWWTLLERSLCEVFFGNFIQRNMYSQNIWLTFLWQIRYLWLFNRNEIMAVAIITNLWKYSNPDLIVCHLWRGHIPHSNLMNNRGPWTYKRHIVNFICTYL